MKMPLPFLATSFLLCALSVARADPRSEVSEAIAKLSGQPGYSWILTPKSEGTKTSGRATPLEGKTEKDGFTRVKGASGETSYEVGYKGDKIVVNYNGDWLSAAEIGENNNIVQRLKAFKKPADEAADLAKKTKELKRESDGHYAGELAPEAAKELFALLGRRAAEAPSAQGLVKFWIKDGQLTKYEFMVHGKITAGADKEEVEISRTMTVEIKDVGPTKVSFPDEAKKKLS